MTEAMNPIRPTTPEAIKLAKTIMRTSRYGAVAVLDLAGNRPMASRVGVATDIDGTPIILVSELAPHTSALRRHPPCSLLLGEVGKGDPMAHARITLSCFAEFIDRSSTDFARVRRRFINHNPKSALYADLGDFNFVRLNVEMASLNGGFGKAFSLNPDELISNAKAADNIALSEQKVLDRLNETHTETFANYHASLNAEKSAWKLIGLDPDGFNLASGNQVLRTHFQTPCDSIEDAVDALELMFQSN